MTNAQGVPSELLALHPGVDVAVGLLRRDAGPRLDHRAQLTLGLDCRTIEVRQELPFLPSVMHVARFARHDIGGFAALKTEHDCLRRAGIPGENVDSGWSKTLASFACGPTACVLQGDIANNG